MSGLSFTPLASLPIPGDVLSALQTAGYVYYEDVKLERGSVAFNILKRITNNVDRFWKTLTVVPETTTAFMVWQEESKSFGIVTFCKAIDDMLGGGVPLQRITEFCGSPGSGKTQLCLQLSVDVQIPKVFFGHEAEAVFIDTSSNVTLTRLAEMAEACVEHCSAIAKKQRLSPISTFNVKKIMGGIHYMPVNDHVQLLAAVYQLTDFLPKRNIKLIVIDSITLPLLCGELNGIERIRILYQIIEELQAYALKFNAAVVLTNQLTTRILSDGRSEVVPALGESLGHRVNQRLLLGAKNDDTFTAVLLKSPTFPSVSVDFKITWVGVRDIGNC